MFHEPPKQFLYSAYKIETQFSDGTKIKSGLATCFVIEIAKGFPWIVTNRHVIDLDYRQTTPKYKDFKLAKFIITGRRPDDTEYSLELHPESKFYFHNSIENDIVLIQPRVSKGKDFKIHWHFTLEHLADRNHFNEINIFDLVCYSGFPNQHDKLKNRPILRSGHIASDPNYDYSWNSEFQGQCVAYEGFSSEGASGSPIFAPPRGMQTIPNSRNGFLIGVNAGHIPDILGHSGISYFYKSIVICDIIEKYKLKEMKIEQ